MEYQPGNNHGHTITQSLCLWLILMTILAAGLRLPKLGHWSLWEDELYTVRSCSHLADMPYSKMLGYVPTAITLRFYGIDLDSIPSEQPAQWRSMGITEWPIRLASCLIGIITIPLLGLASVRLLGTRAAGLLALLLAVAPWHIYWSQAARFYTQQFLFYNLALIFYFVATERGSRGRFTLAMVFTVLGFLSQPPALVIAAIFAGDWLIALARRQPVRLGWYGWVVGIATVLLCLGIADIDLWQSGDGFNHLAHQPSAHNPRVMVLGTALYVTPPVVIFTLLSGLGFLRRKPRLTIYLLLGAMVPVLVLIVLFLTNKYVHVRYAFVSLYACLALAALGLDQL